MQKYAVLILAFLIELKNVIKLFLTKCSIFQNLIKKTTTTNNNKYVSKNYMQILYKNIVGLIKT